MAAHFSPGYGYQNGQMAEQARPAGQGEGLAAASKDEIRATKGGKTHHDKKILHPLTL